MFGFVGEQMMFTHIIQKTLIFLGVIWLVYEEGVILSIYVDLSIVEKMVASRKLECL